MVASGCEHSREQREGGDESRAGVVVHTLELFMLNLKLTVYVFFFFFILIIFNININYKKVFLISAEPINSCMDYRALTASEQIFQLLHSIKGYKMTFTYLGFVMIKRMI